MSVEEKIGQIILSGIAGTGKTEETCSTIARLKPGGIFFMPHNVINPEQLRQFSAALQDCADSEGIDPLLISIDHEGESSYFFETGITNFPTQLGIGATTDPAYAYRVAQAAGSELAYSGVNHILGPVADVYTNLDNRLFAIRTYGGDARQVGEFVAEAVKGYTQAGLIPTLKHFPGHGGSDTFYASKILPVDNVTAETFASTYLPPFWSGLEAGSPVMLVGHVVYPYITGTYNSATQSPQIIRILRDQANFDGVVMSDAILSAEGITNEYGDVPEAALEVFNAGVDLLFIPEDGQAVATHDRFLDALDKGELSPERLNEAVSRILALKVSYGLKDFPVIQAPQPDWQKNASLAIEVGQKAVALFRDTEKLIPIPARIETILVIGPDESWEFYADLETQLENQGREVDFVYYSPPWKGTVKEREYVQTLPEKAAEYDLTIFFTWQAHLNALGKDAWQARLGKKLSNLDKPVIIVALNNPTDIYEFPKIGTFLATHGTTEGQLGALIKTFLGEWTPIGKIPFPEFYD
jgi:beta-N-acetylhexosaminidase